MALALAAGLSTRQVLGHRMSPRMRTYLRLLAQPIGDLREEVKREVESNPAIDDVDFSPFFRRTGGGVSSEVADAMLANVQARGESLDEHLMRELRLSELTGTAYDACAAVIANLDDHGRFVGSIPDMVMAYPDLTEASIEAARRRVMAFDPLGCGAKDTAECLTAQLGRIPAADRAAVAQVIAKWDDLMGGRLSVGDIDAQALLAFRKYKGKLVANPGEDFAPKKVDVVNPDITVDKKGEVHVDMADIPEIKVSTKYLMMCRDPSLDAETRKYAQERVRHAKELQQALMDRQETMSTIAEIAIGSQPEFLRRGEAGLKPLTMTEVAKKAKCDVSTVSRAAARKFVRTQKGTVPLRKFFSLVDQAPIAKLKEILDESRRTGEKLSDQKVSELMKKEGFSMARRTVAKYRAKLAGRC